VVKTLDNGTEEPFGIDVVSKYALQRRGSLARLSG
jgi:hypothetical protein